MDIYIIAQNYKDIPITVWDVKLVDDNQKIGEINMIDKSNFEFKSDFYINEKSDDLIELRDKVQNQIIYPKNALN